ncbi:MAG TPA: S41 family peptidase, partial [Kofleriaceae bacterium]|nr:S41 family peptidase [Kofleriaceae bacterium]
MRRLVAVAWIAGCAGGVTPAPPARPLPVPAPVPDADRVPFSPDARVAELAVLRDALRDDYAHLETKRAQWGVDLDALFARYAPRIRGAGTWVAYEAVMVAFVAELHDGHVQWRRKRGAGETRRRIARLPLDTRFVGEQLIVTDVWSGAERAGLQRGDRIVALDGTSIEERLGELERLRSWARLDAARHDFAEEWVVSRVATQGEVMARRLTRERTDGTYETLAVVPDTTPRPGARPPRIELTWRGRAAVLAVHDLTGHLRDTQQLATDAAAAAFASPHGLVIDLRDDEGGFEDAALAIASRFTDRPVIGGSTRVKLSAAARAQQPAWRELPEDPAKPGWSTVQPLQAPAGAPRAYPAPIAVVIDTGCRSSCESLALLLRAIGARLYGERTGGAGGAPITIELPSSKAHVGIPARASFDTAGTPIEGVGVAPDESVAPTRAELAAGRDVALERALA